MGGPRGFGLAGLVGILSIGVDQASDFYRCSTRGAFVVSLDLASGSGLDYVGTFTCSEGSHVDMRLGTNGNGEYHFESSGSGYTGLKLGAWDADMYIASALAFKRASDGNYGTPYGSDYICCNVPEKLCSAGLKIGGFYATSIGTRDGSRTMVYYTFSPLCVAAAAFTCKNPGTFIASVAIQWFDAVYYVESFTCTDGTFIPVGVGAAGLNVHHNTETGGPFNAIKSGYYFPADSQVLAGLQFKKVNDNDYYGTVYGYDHVDESEHACGPGSYMDGLFISEVFWEESQLAYGVIAGTTIPTSPYIGSDISPHCACHISISNCITPASDGGGGSNCNCSICASGYQIVNNADGTATCAACPVSIANCITYGSDCKCTACGAGYVVATDSATHTTTCETPAVKKTCPTGSLITAVTVQASSSSSSSGAVIQIVSFTCLGPNGSAEVSVGIGGSGGGSAVATGGPFRGFQNTYYDHAGSGACAALSFMSAATSTYGTVFGASSGVPVPKLCPLTQTMSGMSLSRVHYIDLDLVAQDIQPICSSKTLAPTFSPPTNAPTNAPTSAPTSSPTSAPSNAPTPAPNPPTPAPSNAPTNAPTPVPTNAPSKMPTQVPTQVPSTGYITPVPVTPVPSATATPTSNPTATSCKAGYYLSGGACAQCSSSTYHCAKYVAPAAGDSINCKCSSCKAGYLLNRNGYTCDVCSSSIYHCSKYIATTGTDPVCQCSGCKSAYSLTGTSCVACTSSHCSTYVTNSCDCTSCKTGYGISGTKCGKCSSTYNCATYISPATTNPVCGCSVCNTGHTLSNGVCA